MCHAPVFGVREIPFGYSVDGVNEYGGAVDEACAKKILSNPVIYGDELKFLNLDALAQTPASSSNLLLFLSPTVFIILDTLPCSYNLRKFDTLAKTIFARLALSGEKFLPVIYNNNKSKRQQSGGSRNCFTRFLLSLVLSWAIAV